MKAERITCVTPSGRHNRWVNNGGCDQNPGWFGSGHGSVKLVQVCETCGVSRVTDYGASDHRGLKTTKVTYSAGCAD
jgi:hypothetical protein